MTAPLYRPRHKFHAEPETRGEILFASKAEARYYDLLELRRRPGGDVLGFLRQVPIHLPGNTRLVIDFVVWHRDGSCTFEDVKGVETEVWRLKLRQVLDLYPWLEIEVVTMRGAAVKSRRVHTGGAAKETR